ncbi:MAG: hypothetical protein Q8O95_05490 [bacterium]|nr:hypothetical protein [bacterium]
MAASSKTRISAFLPDLIVTTMKQTAESKGVTQSAILQEAMEMWLNKRLEEDAKALAKIPFDDLPSEDDWIAIQAETLKGL